MYDMDEDNVKPTHCRSCSYNPCICRTPDFSTKKQYRKRKKKEQIEDDIEAGLRNP
jgi:hypothetical protein